MSAINSNSDDRDLEAIRRAQRAHEPSMEEILASIRNIIADEASPRRSRRPNRRRRGRLSHPRRKSSIRRTRPRRTASPPSPLSGRTPNAPTVVWRRPQPADSESAADAGPARRGAASVVGGERSGDGVVRRLVGQSRGAQRRARRQPGARDAASDAQAVAGREPAGPGRAIGAGGDPARRARAEVGEPPAPGSRVDFGRDDAFIAPAARSGFGARSLRRRPEGRHPISKSRSGGASRGPEFHDGQIVRLRRGRRPRLRALGGDGRVPGGAPRAGRGAAVLRRHSAAERHRQSAHGPCAQQYAAGHPVPLLAHERPRRAVAAGRRPCRHRHADGRRTHAHGAAGARSARLGPQGVRRARLGVEGGIGRRDRGPAQAPRRLLRLEPRAVHARRGPLARGRQGVRPALSRAAHLQGQAARQLGPQVPDRDLGSRGRAGRGQGLVQMVARGRRAARRGGARQGCWPRIRTAICTTSTIRSWTPTARRPANA